MPRKFASRTRYTKIRVAWADVDDFLPESDELPPKIPHRRRASPLTLVEMMVDHWACTKRNLPPMSYTEISRILGLSHQAVEQIEKRAIRKLRRKLEYWCVSHGIFDKEEQRALFLR